MQHLWEVDHSYYMTEGNYYSNDCHTEFKKWTDFLAEWGDADFDMNYVVRWDWIEDAEPIDDYDREGRLLIQFVGQRKARLLSTETAVCRADEKGVFAFLNPRFDYAMKLWLPITT